MVDPVVKAAADYAEEVFSGDASGHDAHHTLRVYRTALALAEEEGADARVVALAALLHDVDDHKVSPETSATLGNARAFLEAHGVAGDEAERVLAAVSEVSYSKNGGSAPSSIESACVRDADRLDAIGAVGVARAFAFGGSRGRAMHDPNDPLGQSTVAHFHDKLLKLKGLMCTRAGARRAESRDAYLRGFLDEFLAEWDGEA